MAGSVIVETEAPFGTNAGGFVSCHTVYGLERFDDERRVARPHFAVSHMTQSDCSHLEAIVCEELAGVCNVADLRLDMEDFRIRSYTEDDRDGLPVHVVNCSVSVDDAQFGFEIARRDDVDVNPTLVAHELAHSIETLIDSIWSHTVRPRIEPAGGPD